jgi:hypothetical protein
MPLGPNGIVQTWRVAPVGIATAVGVGDDPVAGGRRRRPEQRLELRPGHVRVHARVERPCRVIRLGQDGDRLVDAAQLVVALERVRVERRGERDQRRVGDLRPERRGVDLVAGCRLEQRMKVPSCH